MTNVRSTDIAAYIVWLLLLTVRGLLLLFSLKLSFNLLALAPFLKSTNALVRFLNAIWPLNSLFWLLPCQIADRPRGVSNELRVVGIGLEKCNLVIVENLPRVNGCSEDGYKNKKKSSYRRNRFDVHRVMSVNLIDRECNRLMSQKSRQKTP